MIRFICVRYPNLEVLVNRASNSWARFQNGSLETDDTEMIAHLDKTEFVYRADDIDPEQVRVVMVDEATQDVVAAKPNYLASEKRMRGKK